MHSNGINDNLFLKINFADNQPYLAEGRSNEHDQTHHEPAIMLVGWMLSDELAHPVGVRVEFACKVIFSLLWRSKKTSSSIWSTWSYQHYHQHHEHDRPRPHIIINSMSMIVFVHTSSSSTSLFLTRCPLAEKLPVVAGNIWNSDLNWTITDDWKVSHLELISEFFQYKLVCLISTTVWQLTRCTWGCTSCQPQCRPGLSSSLSPEQLGPAGQNAISSTSSSSGRAGQQQQHHVSHHDVCIKSTSSSLSAISFSVTYNQYQNHFLGALVSSMWLKNWISLDLVVGSLWLFSISFPLHLVVRL